MATLKPLDVTAQPYLSGPFAPVAREVESSRLVVEGRVPDGLIGAYLRNGPNPMFPQFTSWEFTQGAKASGLLPSMGSVGDG